MVSINLPPVTGKEKGDPYYLTFTGTILLHGFLVVNLCTTLLGFSVYLSFEIELI